MPQSKKEASSETPELMEQVSNFASENSDMIKKEVTQLVKKHPLAAIAVAAGVGFLIGRLFSSRNK